MRRGLALFLLASIFLAACTTTTPVENGEVISLDASPRFREVYTHLLWRGEYFLGESVSGICKPAGTAIEKQYFENGVLVYNPQTSPRYYLEALPGGLVPNHLVPLQSVPPNSSYVGGRIVIGDFMPLYEEYGKRWLGEPTTSTLWNPQLERYEQYFENMAVFRYEDDPQGVVRYLPTGKTRDSIKNCSVSVSSEEGGAATNRGTPPTQSPPSDSNPAAQPTQAPSLGLHIWVLHHEITSSQTQIFGGCVTAGNGPLLEYTATLRTLHDGRTYPFPAPDAKGCSYISLPPIEKSDGTLIEYQVCATSSWGETLCQNDNFLIWSNP